MAKLKIGILILLISTLIYFIFTITYLKYSYFNTFNKSSQNCPNIETKKISNNQISFNLNIMDIYRIDVSCNYITRDLGEKISNSYVNYKKRCSFSSLNKDINSKIEKSLSKIDLKTYIPNIDVNSIKFNPFNSTSQDNEIIFKNLNAGGVWHPKFDTNKECNLADVDNIIFIVPFSRSRLDNLKLFLVNMHSYLQNYSSQFKYRILVVEQIDMDSKFNKGRLINSAVKYVIDNLNQDLVDCIVIHDVDLIPSENGKILEESGDYRCRKMPWHLSQKVFNLNTKQERIYNQFLTGGILSLRLDHFIKVNGFSNEYFGWGAEDDDFQIRMFNSNLCIMRPESKYTKAPFTMLIHSSSNANSNRFSILSTSLIRQPLDGLSNIFSLSKIENVKYFKSFTYLAVKVLN